MDAPAIIRLLYNKDICKMCIRDRDKTDIGEAESADDRKCMRAYEICIIDHGIGMTKEQAAKIRFGDLGCLRARFATT